MQKAYDSAKAGAIIQGILANAFTIAALTALVFGQGSLAVRLGMTAGMNFAMMIYDTMNVGQLSM